MPKSALLNDDQSRNYIDLLRCPICHDSMDLTNMKSLICNNKHCFDLAKQGYVNLLSHGVKTKYNKHLFEARKSLAQSGFFEPLNKLLCELIVAESKPQHPSVIKILDAGCGEGSHLANIQQELSRQVEMMVLGIGMDLSKEGIQIAARDYNNIFWCVADLAQCPFQNQKFDVILNILSPANYSEFERILAKDGVVMKVIPEKNYLKELREIFYKETENLDYSNTKTIELFRNHMDYYKAVPLRYTMTLDQPLIANLVHMTPLTWGAEEKRIEEVLKLESIKLSVDFTIMVGRKRG